MDQPVEVLDIIRIGRVPELEELGPMGFRELSAFPIKRDVIHASGLL
jgi:hypothetical protein